MIAGAIRWVFTAAFGGSLAALFGALAVTAAVLLLVGHVVVNLRGWC